MPARKKATSKPKPTPKPVPAEPIEADRPESEMLDSSYHDEVREEEQRPDGEALA